MTESRSRIRLFPALLVVLAGSLVMKLVAVTSGIQAMLDQNAAVAQESSADPAAMEPVAQAAQPGETGTASMAKPDTMAQDADDGDMPMSPYPENWTREEVELMLSLAERKKEMDKREAAIRDKEVVLLAVEKRIDGKIAELKQMETTITELIKGFDAEEMAKFDSLKGMILAMSDKDAAPFLVDLNLVEQVEIMKDLDAKKASKILVAIRKIDAGKATDLARALAERKSRPTLDDVRAANG